MTAGLTAHEGAGAEPIQPVRDVGGRKPVGSVKDVDGGAIGLIQDV